MPAGLEFMPITKGNLYALVPVAEASGERVEVLRRTSCMTLERIVSFSQATPPGQWYDQAWDEWVVLLQGSAGLRLEGDDEAIELMAGDFVMLPAHLRHRVDWTDPQVPTVWLALHHAPDNRANAQPR